MVTMFGFTELPQKVSMKAFSLDTLSTYIVEELKLGRAIHLYLEFSMKLASLPLVIWMQQDCHYSRMKKVK